MWKSCWRSSLRVGTSGSRPKQRTPHVSCRWASLDSICKFLLLQASPTRVERFRDDRGPAPPLAPRSWRLPCRGHWEPSGDTLSFGLSWIALHHGCGHRWFGGPASHSESPNFKHMFLGDFFDADTCCAKHMSKNRWVGQWRHSALLSILCGAPR